MDVEILISPNLALIGFSWFTKDKILDYNEFNINLLCLKISFIWGMNDDDNEI